MGKAKAKEEGGFVLMTIKSVFKKQPGLLKDLHFFSRIELGSLMLTKEGRCNPFLYVFNNCMGQKYKHSRTMSCMLQTIKKYIPDAAATHKMKMGERACGFERSLRGRVSRLRFSFVWAR